MNEWITFQWYELAMVVLSGIVIYAAILGYTRLTGLRSFSKMSAADFAMTVAVGSLFASTVSQADPSIMIGLVELATLFGGQWLLAFLRQRSATFSQLVDNQPMLLMIKGQVIEENMRKANVTNADINAKIREANAFNLNEVFAVVFETTGNISVLHSSNPQAKLDSALFEGVSGKERLPPEILLSNSVRDPQEGSA